MSPALGVLGTLGVGAGEGQACLVSTEGSGLLFRDDPREDGGATPGPPHTDSPSAGCAVPGKHAGCREQEPGAGGVSVLTGSRTPRSFVCHLQELAGECRAASLAVVCGVSVCRHATARGSLTEPLEGSE